MRRSRRRWFRTALLAVVCALASALAAASASAAGLPPEGVFEGCTLNTEMSTCVARLQVMHQGGMQIVAISPSEESPASIASYASSAQSLGMSVMWELSNPNWWQDPSGTNMDGSYQGFASACGCTENEQLLAYLVHWLGQLPATYGYYVADDLALAPGDETALTAYVNEIKQQDPGHTVMIGSADESQTASYQSIPDVIGTEIYPVTTNSLMPVGSNQDMWDSIAQWAGDAQSSADAAGKQSAFILQAFTWGDNLSDGQMIGACTSSDTAQSCYSKLVYPSAADQLQLRNEILTHAHPKLILWWSFPGTFGNVTGSTYSIYPSGADATSRWSGLAAAVQAPFPQTGGGSSASSPGSLSAHIAGVSSVRTRHLQRHRRRHRRRHHRRHRRHKRHR